MAWALARNREPVKLARQAHREIADVDHLLHFAEAFLMNLAHLETDKRAEHVFMFAQFLAEQAHQLAALRRRHIAPEFERFDALCDFRFDRRRIIETHAADFRAIDGRMNRVIAERLDAEIGEKIGRFHYLLHFLPSP